MEDVYTVRQTVEKTGVKSHVLRYWEEELELRIHRNEMGHRYYTANDIQLFLKVKELKDRGLQLKAIRDLIPPMARIAPGSTDSRVRLLEGEVMESPGEQEALSEQEIPGEQEMPEDTKDKILEFQQILERLIRQELELKKSGERRYQSLDRSIRKRQLARMEAAAASAPRKKEKRRKKAGSE